ncbi:NAD+ synthase [Actinosynnema sp. NPDC020468]|uniref:NAD+ synthase n=1 Tax=Actinosynnema sp. NPDC020468 TaxID=3154488 RepID=UPI0033C729A7
MSSLRVALCQVNPHVGDLDGNVARILDQLDRAEAAGADVALFPELAITGYPPEDLLLKPGFVRDGLERLDRVAAATRGRRCVAVVGYAAVERDLFNAAAVCADGAVVGTYHKRHLPNYAVFDERRYFVPGRAPSTLFRIGGTTVGVAICEDVWNPAGPIAEQAAGGAELVLVLNASPYFVGRIEERDRMLRTRAVDSAVAIAYVNQVGGQDELVFDGGSTVIDATGEVVARAPQFEEVQQVVDVPVGPVWRNRLLSSREDLPTASLPVVSLPHKATTTAPVPTTPAPRLGRLAEIYAALVLGTRDYARKNGFTDVVLGLSGGLDSALVAAIAADAVGPERVHAVALPTRYSSDESSTDAKVVAGNLGIDFRTIPVEPAFGATLDMLAPSFAGLEPDVTEENLQGRIRANVMMALANKFPGWLVLICGNKSELAVGYTTVYGIDMAGGFAVLKDLTKTTVGALARHRNEVAGHDLIPEAILTKPPSAELRPGQVDTDSLPPYPELDPIVVAYVEQDATAEDLIAAGHPEDLVRRITRLIDVAEWKRRQAPVGVRVTAKAFGKDRRMPITNGYRW